MFQIQLTRAIHRMWRNKGVVSTLLLPLSWLTHAFVRRKIARYKQQTAKSWRSDRPVVIVGNIYVGGTGKTPVVMALVESLTQRGWKPGVVSRGYGVQIGPDARTGQGNLDPARFGDEPALIGESTGAPVAVHPSRVNAAKALVRDYPDVDVIVSDDGLQHLALARDAEIVVQDTRGIGNGRLLPAGPLREPAIKMADVDVIVTNQPSGNDDAPTLPSMPKTSRPAPIHVTMTLTPCEMIHVQTGKRLDWVAWLTQYQHFSLSAVAAIGHPERFFDMLRQQGLILNETQALPDHTQYLAPTFGAISTDVILITTKDAVKCGKVDDNRLWAVCVTPHFSDLLWVDIIHEKLRTAAQQRLA